MGVTQETEPILLSMDLVIHRCMIMNQEIVTFSVRWRFSCGGGLRSTCSTLWSLIKLFFPGSSPLLCVELVFSGILKFMQKLGQVGMISPVP